MGSVCSEDEGSAHPSNQRHAFPFSTRIFTLDRQRLPDWELSGIESIVYGQLGFSLRDNAQKAEALIAGRP